MSDILVTGTIMQALPVQQGVSQRGNQWVRQSYIIEHEHGQYPKQMIFDVSNAKIQELNLQIGEEVTVHLNISMREYPQGSGKYFNSIEAWKVDRQFAQQPQYQPVAQPMQQQPQYQQPMQSPFPQQPAAAAPFPPQGGQQPVQPAAQPAAQPTAQPQQGGLPFPPAQ